MVVMNVPSIKKYVFGTDRLVEIRGASGLLEFLFREKTETFLVERFSKAHVEKVFVGGGAAMFLVESDQAELAICVEELETLFSEEAGGGLRLVWGMARFEEKGFRKARIEAENRAAAKQDSPLFSEGLLHTGFAAECESCAEMASFIMDHRQEERLLCRACHAKDGFGVKKKNWLWDKFADDLKDAGLSTNRPRTFEEIGSLCRTKPGYIALVYADGNSMGKLIQEIDDRKRFRFFSETVDESLRKACHETLIQLFFSDNKEIPETLPADILLLGGDDLVVYVKADSALNFAVEAAQRFNDLTRNRIEEYTKRENDSFFKDRLGNNGLTVSFGIAFGKTHTPLSILMDQADQLLLSAKKKGR